MPNARAAVAQCQCAEPIPEPLGPGAHAPQELRVTDGFEHPQRHGGDQGVAVIGPAVIARFENTPALVGHHRGNGHAAAQALAQSQHVRFDPRCLMGEQGPRATQAGLHFVENQQQILLVR